MTTDDRVCFFIHVMKTAGGTFRNHLLANFPRREVYPDWDIDTGPANLDIATLCSIDDARSATTRAYSGHFPYFATDLVEQRIGRPLTRLTILRDPVERTLSLLRDMRNWNDDTAGRSLESLYDDPMLNPLFIRDHQVKIFALDPTDGAATYQHVIEIDDDRAERARGRLATVDIVGLREDFGGFLDEVRVRLGWTIGAAPDRHVSVDDPEVSDDFRRRIAADNHRDVEFHSFARELVHERSGV